MSFSGISFSVRYPATHWAQLSELRKTAISIMRILDEHNLVSALYGSVARGDIRSQSDIDIIILTPASSTRVEFALASRDISIYQRRITQATPNLTPKAHFYLDPLQKQCISLPLIPLRSLESEFYKFGGLISLNNLLVGTRVPGCTKRLMLIQPTLQGHDESPIQDYEAEVAKIIGVKVAIVHQRVRVLTRREEVGRTGILLSYDLHDDEVFEEVLKRLADTNPIVKRRLRRKK
jgi:predicted nucleotidyltransferase